jgi:hypothetical protein
MEKKDNSINVYQQYIKFNNDWLSWQRKISYLISERGDNCDEIKIIMSQLEKYMFESELGSMWYDCHCPDLSKNVSDTTFFLFWFKKHENENERNTFLFNYSKYKYLKSVGNKEYELPVELKSEDAKLIFKKAIDLNLITKKSDKCYVWNETNELFSYFAKSMSLFLHLSNKQHDGKYDISWKPFERLFINKNGEIYKKDALKIAMQGWMQNNCVNSREEFFPKRHEIIDKCFLK